MITVAIMQPTYLPWIGYFDMIDQVDVFILLDNVQFEKRSWQQRNRIRTSHGLEYLTVPVKVKGKQDQLINKVEISQDDAFPLKHIRTIEHHYHRSNFFSEYFPAFKAKLLDGTTEKLLSKLNISLIHWFFDQLGINTNIKLASEFAIEGRRSELLIKLCKAVKGDKYLSPVRSLNYIRQDAREFSEANLGVIFHNYLHPTYRQLYTPFEPYASIIDLLFNEGGRSMAIIKSGRREPIALEEMQL